MHGGLVCYYLALICVLWLFVFFLLFAYCFGLGFVCLLAICCFLLVDLFVGCCFIGCCLHWVFVISYLCFDVACY